MTAPAAADWLRIGADVEIDLRTGRQRAVLRARNYDAEDWKRIVDALLPALAGAKPKPAREAR